MDIEVFILAGGKSTRMGNDKGLTLFDGKPMVEYSIELARKVSGSITIVSGNSDYLKFDVKVVKDELPDLGPIGGIYTALLLCKAENILILTVDSPMLTIELIEKLLLNHAQSDISYLKHDSRTYPLTAVYSKSTLGVIKQQIAIGNFKVRDCFNNLRCNSVEVDFNQRNQLANINTYKELEKYEGKR
ncbi:MAG: molybdenum cofactor guanylyltransferase [Flavobacteriales bacterium]|nr:molybdenum cofactor guanylyltransferase [Flavobacteriales bacterium]